MSEPKQLDVSSLIDDAMRAELQAQSYDASRRLMSRAAYEIAARIVEAEYLPLIEEEVRAVLTMTLTPEAIRYIAKEAAEKAMPRSGPVTVRQSLYPPRPE